MGCGDGVDLPALPEELLNGLAAQVIQDALRHHRRIGIHREIGEFIWRIAQAGKLFANYIQRDRAVVCQFERTIGPGDGGGVIGGIGEGSGQIVSQACGDMSAEGLAMGYGIAREGGFQAFADGRIVGLPDNRTDCNCGEIDVAATEA